jgi:drug/metabolite transporter (DMT)-like permease
VFWRFLVSTVTLLIALLVLKKMDFKIANKKLLIFLGIANAAGYILQYVSIGYTTAAKAHFLLI